MSANRDELAAQKELLIARSALYRAQVCYQIVSVRVRVSRASSWIVRGATLLSILRTALSMAALFRR